ncbi:hypothetical protein J7J13_01860 [bacterium]|nr:hypothetical protein [bacterium]
MAEVNKDICFYITEGCFDFGFSNWGITFKDLENEGMVVYRCPAQGREKYEESDFQEFIKEQNIKPSDKIAIACWTKDAYVVAKSS